jgi:diamine N-acetyltransferase
MKLRLPKLDDAKKMLTTLSDSSINEYMTFSGKKFELEEIVNFIKNANRDSKNLHLVIASNLDDYLGTVSLKNLDFVNRRAEYSIVLSPESVGSGIATDSSNTVFSIGFHYLNFENIYLSVDKHNLRAIRFYEKSGFASTKFGNLALNTLNKENLRWFIVKPSPNYSIELLSRLDREVFDFLDRIKEA